MAYVGQAEMCVFLLVIEHFTIDFCSVVNGLGKCSCVDPQASWSPTASASGPTDQNIMGHSGPVDQLTMI